MKIRIEIDEHAAEEEIVLRCRELNEDVIAMQKRLVGVINEGMKLAVTKGDAEYYLNLSEILFFETAGNAVAVHTVSQIYTTTLRLYELEELLPAGFLRVSKSTILNAERVRSVRKNITGASEVEFDGTGRKAFVSRSYFKLLLNKLEEKRLRK
ncbi:MAG: LytTR family transcriptional regulator [Lachnospiraceae bacterium]|nr:LytTR family transcriptional regulator [Lachnospiraceae bacterium]